MQSSLLLVLVVGVVDAGSLLYVQQQPQSSNEHTVCPDQNSKCPNTATCCQLSSGQWGCCPFPHASCCPDQEHCCPQGFSCNAKKAQCVKAINNETIPWAKKEPSAVSSFETDSPSNAMQCADGSVCPGTAACCRTYSGSFRCCNYPNDVCCSDGLSCCPRCTICDILNKRCVTAFTTEEWKPLTESTPVAVESNVAPALEKVPATFVGDSTDKSLMERLVGVVWCDSIHYCPSFQTCCLQPGGIWGCCPMQHATCCSGSRYCCPPGRRCSYPPGSCY